MHTHPTACAFISNLNLSLDLHDYYPHVFPWYFPPIGAEDTTVMARQVLNVAVVLPVQQLMVQSNIIILRHLAFYTGQVANGKQNKRYNVAMLRMESAIKYSTGKV